MRVRRRKLNSLTLTHYAFLRFISFDSSPTPNTMNREMTHDIHRVRELSALLEERRRYFDGQLGEVYRNAGVSSPSASLPRLRGLDSPPVSASVSESNMTDISLLGSDVTTAGSMDLGSACSARSYSVFADDECSVADSYEFAETKARLGRNWSSSTLLGAANNASSKARLGNLPKDSIHNEVMRAADLEKKLKSRRSSLPLALETSLRRPVNKTFTGNWRKDRKDEGRKSLAYKYTLAARNKSYSDSSDPEDSQGRFPSDTRKGSGDLFSMTDTLVKTRKYEVANDLKRALELPSLSLLRHGKASVKSLDRANWDGDIVGGAPRLKTKFSPRRSLGSKSASSTLAPYADYSPRSSLSTLSGSYPRIAFTSLEKVYREDGDKSKYGLHGHLLLKPLPKMDLFPEQGHLEPDYSHDFRYLSLLDALVPVFQPGNSWKPPSSHQSDQMLLSIHPYRPQPDTSLNRFFPS
ncbi:unnamed protein product [Allacma fusca]|uniref:Uncharacterized protein n=1 Tax=Allacma fusca TaxID=39272 RepID=A0A8J2PRF9_9HEXA|nr:unnamed protein product [Allacma fusca]